jgi:3-oxoacyl-[acyl-carrier protein] reductase
VNELHHRTFSGSETGPLCGYWQAARAGAVDVITKSLAAELGPRHILVNAVLPGPVDTEGNRAMANADQINAAFLARTPLGRIGRPHDIATVVSFLVSPEAGWITGQIIQAVGRLR